MKTPVFEGSCTAMITPFDDDGLDLKRLGVQLDFQERNGTAAVLVGGTTGESAALDEHEYRQLVESCVRQVSKRMKVLCAIGGNNTPRCLDRAKIAQESGADAVLMTLPYYNLGTPAGRLDNFFYIADRIDLPLIIYNVPARTVAGLTWEDYKALSRHPNINGVKEASGDVTLCARTLCACGDDFHVWSGSDDTTVSMMALGARGVISVASNLIPGQVSSLCSLCESGAYRSAAALYLRYVPLLEALFSEVNPIPIKAAMKLNGLDSGMLRRPLTNLSESNLTVLAQRMRSVGLDA